MAKSYKSGCTPQRKEMMCYEGICSADGEGARERVSEEATLGLRKQFAGTRRHSWCSDVEVNTLRYTSKIRKSRKCQVYGDSIITTLVNTYYVGVAVQGDTARKRQHGF